MTQQWDSLVWAEPSEAASPDDLWAYIHRLQGALVEVLPTEEPRRYVRQIWGTDFGLSPMELELIQALHKAGPSGMTATRLSAVLYPDEDRAPDDSKAALYAHIGNIRRKMTVLCRQFRCHLWVKSGEGYNAPYTVELRDGV